MAGLRTIADHLGVSVSLVSKVLNNRLGTTSVSDDLATAIRKKAAELNYSPNKTARALVTGRQHVLGVIIHSMGEKTSGICEELVRTLAAEADNQQQRLWLNFCETSARIRELLAQSSRSVVDGLLIAGMSHEDVAEDLLQTEKSGVPVVTLHDKPLHPQITNVGCPQTEVGRLAVSHLVGQGARQIACLNCNVARFEGYQAGLNEAGIEFDPRLVVPARYDYEHGRRAVEELLARNLPFDAVVAHSDLHGLATVTTLNQRGIRVPDDVCVTGVDDSPLSPVCNVPLTSISQQFAERARLATQLLMKRISGEPVQSVDIAPVLRGRKSSVRVAE